MVSFVGAAPLAAFTGWTEPQPGSRHVSRISHRREIGGKQSRRASLEDRHRRRDQQDSRRETERERGTPTRRSGPSDSWNSPRDECAHDPRPFAGEVSCERLRTGSGERRWAANARSGAPGAARSRLDASAARRLSCATRSTARGQQLRDQPLVIVRTSLLVDGPVGARTGTATIAWTSSATRVPMVADERSEAPLGGADELTERERRRQREQQQRSGCERRLAAVTRICPLQVPDAGGVALDHERRARRRRCLRTSPR